MLKVKLLRSGAKAPTVAHPGEDLGYDVYAAEGCILVAGLGPVVVKTGISIEDTQGRGFIVKDRSSMAVKGAVTHAGVIDAGYRGEIGVVMSLLGTGWSYGIQPGDKIAQLIPVIPATNSPVSVVENLSSSSRGEGGYGSSGR